MKEELWNDVRKEYEVSNENKLVLKKVTQEPQKKEYARKDIVDLVFRSISLFAIGLPIFLVYFQQRAALRNQKALQQYDVYSSTSFALHTILKRQVTDTAFQKAADKLSYELSPKIDFLYSKEVSDNVDEVNGIISIYKAITNNCDTEDSLYHYEETAASQLSSYRFLNIKEVTVENECSYALKHMDSTGKEIGSYQDTLRMLIEDNTTTNQSVQSILKQAFDLDKTYNSFHVSLNDLCKRIDSVYVKKKNDDSNSIQDLQASLSKNKKELFTLSPQLLDSFRVLKKRMLQNVKLQSENLQESMRKSNKWLDSN